MKDDWSKPIWQLIPPLPGISLREGHVTDSGQWDVRGIMQWALGLLLPFLLWKLLCENTVFRAMAAISQPWDDKSDVGKMEEWACVPDHIFEHSNQPQEKLSLDFLFNNAVNAPKVQATVVHVSGSCSKASYRIQSHTNVLGQGNLSSWLVHSGRREGQLGSHSLVSRAGSALPVGLGPPLHLFELSFP